MPTSLLNQNGGIQCLYDQAIIFTKTLATNVIPKKEKKKKKCKNTPAKRPCTNLSAPSDRAPKYTLPVHID